MPIAPPPLLELVVEAVLRLAGLEIEETQDQRSGKTKERGGKGRAHACERPGKAHLQVVEDGDHVLAFGDREAGQRA
jgi:hypothetical protein